MELTKLYYFHGLINKEYFDGRLEPVIFREFEEDNNDGVVAKVETCLEPFIIWFNKENLKEDDDIFLITVLFHEMIHQYCREHSIEDVAPDGTHLEVFTDIAIEHGLTHNGYGLSADVEGFIKKYLERYEMFQKLDYH